MKDLIESIEAIALSGEDLIEITHKLGGPPSKFILYDQLDRVSKLEDVFGDKSVLFLLYNIDFGGGQFSHVGHWVALIKKNNNDLIYFDSLGLSPAEDISKTHNKNTLLRLLNDWRGDIDINKTPYQANRADTNSCGRYGCIRSIFHHMSNMDFNQHIIMPSIQHGLVKNPDVLVSLMTAFLSKSDQILNQFFGKTYSSQPVKNRGGALFNML